MPDQPDEPDDASEIFSSFVHEMHKEPGEVPDALMVTEKRGIREASWVQFNAPLFQDLKVKTAPADTDALLFIAANRHLRAVGEWDFFAVVDNAEMMARGEYPPPEEISRHLEMWAEGMKKRNGMLSIDTIAARFVQARDQLYFLLFDKPELHAAAFAYADAWHWLHMELFGEHERAAKTEAAWQAADVAQQLAARTIGGRFQGPQAQKQAGALRLSIIELEYKEYAEKEKNLKKRTSAKHAADQILADVNVALKNQGLGSLTAKTLEKRLRPIIKERVKSQNLIASD